MEIDDRQRENSLRTIAYRSYLIFVEDSIKAPRYITQCLKKVGKIYDRHFDHHPCFMVELIYDIGGSVCLNLLRTGAKPQRFR